MHMRQELQEIAQLLDVDFKGLSVEELRYSLTEVSDDCYMSQDVPLHNGTVPNKILIKKFLFFMKLIKSFLK